MHRPYIPLALAVLAGFVVTKAGRLVSPDGGLDAIALLVGVAIASVIALTMDDTVKRPRGR